MKKRKNLIIILLIITSLLIIVGCDNKKEILEDYELNIGDKVYEDFELDESIFKNSVYHLIEWSSSNDNVIEISKDNDKYIAKVTRQSEDVTVTLTVKYENTLKKFDVIVAKKDAEPINKVITFYHTMGDSLATVLDRAIANFEAKFPGWTVEDKAIGGYDDVKSAVLSDLKNQTQPDLTYCYPEHVAQYLTTQKIVDLSKFINSKETINVVKTTYKMDSYGYALDRDGNKIILESKEFQELIGYTSEEINDFVTGYYSEGFATNYADYDKYGYSANSILSMPFVKTTDVLYYNKTALEEVGITKAPETWDELWEDAKLINTKYPNCIPVGYDSESNWFITMCEQNNWGYTSASEPHYLFNDLASKSWLEELAEYYDKGLVTTQNLSGAYTSNLFVKGAKDGAVFSIGSCGIASHYMPTNSAFEWGVATIPGSKIGGEVVNATIYNGPSLCMFYEDNENKDEKALMTWEFVKCMLEPEFLASFSIASGYNPPRKSVFKNSTYQNFLNGTSITAVAAKTASAMVDYYCAVPSFIGSSTARDQIGKATQYVISGQKTAEKALKDAYTNCGGK